MEGLAGIDGNEMTGTVETSGGCEVGTDLDTVVDVGRPLLAGT